MKQVKVNGFILIDEMPNKRWKLWKHEILGFNECFWDNEEPKYIGIHDNERNKNKSHPVAKGTEWNNMTWIFEGTNKVSY